MRIAITALIVLFHWFTAECSDRALAETPHELAQRQLNGQWTCNMVEHQSLVLTIDGPQIAIASETEGVTSVVWVGLLELSADHPTKHFDWIDRKSKGGAMPNNKCLYRCIGDTLLIIGGGPDRRPEKFLSGEGQAPKTLVFTRRTR